MINNDVMNFSCMAECERQYYDYIVEHIENVKKVWVVMKDVVMKRCSSMLEPQVMNIDRIIDVHDQSKFRRIEFHGYRQWFFPDDGKKSKAIFDIAWNHHQKSNPHHWQHWVMYKGNGRNEAVDMPMMYIIEMLCDWTEMSVKFNNFPSVWYLEERQNMLLSEWTDYMINEYMPIMDEVYEIIKATSSSQGE